MSPRTADPLTVLRAYDTPVTPPSEFTARLRRRLEAGPATLLPRPAALPCLTVDDIDRAVDWYAQTFGATVTEKPTALPDNSIGHAALTLGDGELYLSDEGTARRDAAAEPGPTSVSLVLSVPDTDAAVQRARERGAQVERAPADERGARTATLVDPFGHRWILTGAATR